VGFVTVGGETMGLLIHPQHPCWLPWVSETRSGKEPPATGGEPLRWGGPGRPSRRRRWFNTHRRLQRDGYGL